MTNRESLVCDFRSDTVTRPTDAMRRAMAEAEVGDDVYGDDPTVNRLEALAAEITGTEAGLFVPSGTMGNQIALRVATRPGEEGLVEEASHMLLWEVGGAAMISGVQLRPVPGNQGVLDLEALERLVRDARDVHQPRTTFLGIENSHNMAGGTLVPVDHLKELAAFARARGLHFHMDGARLFNAAVALGVPASEIASVPDSTMFCLSKGLGAPVGSMLVGSAATITEGRRVRKALGGGMRQAGILAAAGILALETMVDRLAEDHRRARDLAEGLAELPGTRIDLASVQTNMVYLEVEGGPNAAEELAEQLAPLGVLSVALTGSMLRLVTHNDVGDEHVSRAIEVFREIL